MTAPDGIAKEVGAKIRAARERAHMTQAQVAERLGCTPTAVSYWESGARHLPGHMVSQMAAALGTTAPDLLPSAWFAPVTPPTADSTHQWHCSNGYAPECGPGNPCHPMTCNWSPVPPTVTDTDTVAVPRAELVAAAFIVQEARWCEGLQNWWGADSRNMADLDAALDFLKAAAAAGVSSDR